MHIKYIQIYISTDYLIKIPGVRSDPTCFSEASASAPCLARPRGASMVAFKNESRWADGMRQEQQQQPGWPLVGNEGINLYIAILGIHSLIPY